MSDDKEIEKEIIKLICDGHHPYTNTSKEIINTVRKHTTHDVEWPKRVKHYKDCFCGCQSWNSCVDAFTKILKSKGMI